MKKISSLCLWTVFLVLGLTCTGQASLSITVNESSGPISLSSDSQVCIKVNIDVDNDLTPQVHEVWIYADAPFGCYSFTSAGTWVKGLVPYSTPVAYNLKDLVILCDTPLYTEGQWKFSVAIDNNADYVLDGTFSDSVLVTVSGFNNLEPVDDKPLAERTPLILVHGNSNENRTETKYRWEKFIARCQETNNSQFKMYLFLWDSNKSNYINGISLGAAIDADPELFEKSVVILAHSRGGLVSRFFMNDYIVSQGGYAGKKGGERVKALLTLATPHQGSPGSDPIWTLFDLEYYGNQNIYSSDKVATYTSFYINNLNNSIFYLQWDDIDNEMTGNSVCIDPFWSEDDAYCSTLWHKIYQEVASLNKREAYRDKIIAYGGNSNGHVIGPHDVENLAEHWALSKLSKLFGDMIIISKDYPTAFIDSSYKRFIANDGMVPLSSALYLKEGSGNLFGLEAGKIIYDFDMFNNKCQLKECNLINNRYTDHLHFLDDNEIMDMVISRLVDINLY